MVANKSDFDLKEKQKILFGLYCTRVLPACLGLPPAIG